MAILVIFFASLAQANHDPLKEGSRGDRARLHGKWCAAQQSPVLQSQHPVNALLGRNSVGYVPWVNHITGLPSNTSVMSVQAVDSNMVWANAGIYNQAKFAVHSTNRGATWICDTIKTAPLLFCSSCIYALDASTAFVLMHDHSGTSSGGIFRTTDGGATWDKDATAFKNAGGWASFIHFFDANNGVCVGDPTMSYFEIYTTSNAGASWSRVQEGNIPTSLPTEYSLTNIYIAAGNSLWFPTSKLGTGRIFRTTNKGGTWSVVVFPRMDPGWWPGIGFQDESVGLGMGTPGEVMKTTDGGVTWAMVSTPSNTLVDYNFWHVPKTSGMYITSSYQINDSALVRPGVDGTMYTTDGGANWTLAHTWLGNAPFLSFFNRSIGWATGETNNLYEWKLPAGRYAGVHPDSLAFRMLEAGRVTDTITVDFVNHGTDALTLSSIVSPGSNFTVVQKPVLPAVIQSLGSVKIGIRFTPHVDGVIRDSLLFMSNASNAPALPLYLDGTGLIVQPAQMGTIYGTSGALLSLNLSTGIPVVVGSLGSTTFHGLAIRPSTGELYGIVGLSSGSTLYRISCGSAKFVSVRTFPMNMRGIAFNRNGDLYGASRLGRLYRLNLTTGDTVGIGTAPGMSYSCIAFSPSGKLWATALPTGSGKDRIYTLNTTTGEATLIGATGDSALTPSIFFAPDGKLYGLKGTGTETNSVISIDTLTGVGVPLLSLGISGVTAITTATFGVPVGVEAEKEMPQTFALSQNYPNPFNPTTTIRYSLPNRSRVALTVFNTLGQEVAQLVNGEVEAGYHDVAFNALGLSSGVYFYRIQAGDFVATKKLLHLK
jgi:photosystem II stability/assembly factor-like uncharacterized protein